MALALDGHTVGNWAAGGAQTLTLTTTTANDVVVVMGRIDAAASGAGISSITDTAGLAWQARRAAPDTGGMFCYWAKAPVALSGDVITINFGASVAFATAFAFGISGANTTTPFDPNASLGQEQSLADFANGTITTTNANDFLIGMYGSGAAEMAPATAPWATIDDLATFTYSQYLVVSSPQSARQVANANIGNSVTFYGDAVTAAAAINQVGGSSRTKLGFGLGLGF